MVLLLHWDPNEKHWWILRTRGNGNLTVYPSPAMWNGEIIDLDKIADSYELRRIA